jgi:hypothetical protein
MKASKNKSRRAIAIAQVRKKFIGLTVNWTDKDPLVAVDESLIYSDAVTHKNPILNLTIGRIWREHAHDILTSEFTWRVNVDIFFDAINRKEFKIIKGEFQCSCPLQKKCDSRMNDAIFGFIREERANNDKIAEDIGYAHKSYGVYLRTEFKAVIIGV